MHGWGFHPVRSGGPGRWVPQLPVPTGQAGLDQVLNPRPSTHGLPRKAELREEFLLGKPCFGTRVSSLYWRGSGGHLGAEYLREEHLAGSLGGGGTWGRKSGGGGLLGEGQLGEGPGGGVSWGRGPWGANPSQYEVLDAKWVVRQGGWGLSRAARSWSWASLALGLPCSGSSLPSTPPGKTSSLRTEPPLAVFPGFVVERALAL